uniref:RNA-directed RNA polymerase n=1 Tax=Erysiphales associated tombus-like virus 1 TaxID=2754852 RepID=A0A7D6ETP4_9TOMB|nr:putative RdRp [Erysiphales associated tombus-like virus 1]
MSPPRRIYAFNSSLENLVRGVKERVFFVKDPLGGFTTVPKPLDGVFEARLGSLRDAVVARCPILRPLEREEYPLQYTGKKRATYTKAVETLRSRELTRKDAEVTIFTKTERTVKPDAVPRIVSPMTPECNLETGRFVKPMESPICKAIAEVAGHTVVMKGMNASQIGGILRQNWEEMGGDGYCVAIGLDASRFDQHVAKQALEFEHTHYPSLLADPRDRALLRKLLSWQLETSAFGRTNEGTVKYDIDGTRLSGVINTGLGNCILASLMCIAYCRERGVGFRLANNGDDCVIFLRKRDLAKFQVGLSGWFRDMGFNMVVEDPVYVLEQVVFCQASPVWDGAAWTMVRDPRTALAKDCVSLKPWRNEKEFQSWIKGVGLSGTALAGGIPVFDTFYRSFVQAGGVARPLSHDDPSIGGGLYWMAKGMHRQNLRITDEARCSFWKAFGITPDMQLELEHKYSTTIPKFAPPVLVGDSYPTMDMDYTRCLPPGLG